MFLPFFQTLREEGVPVSVREFLDFLEGIAAGLVTYDPEGFYHFARTTMVKDERHIDRFDRAFARAFAGLGTITPDEVLDRLDLPRNWLEKLAERHLSTEERAAIQALGAFDKLMETLRQRLAEQKERHQGGSKWIGTAGTSPFGAYGYNPEGLMIGQENSRHQRAVKVWDRREFRNLDGDAEIGTRTIKLALRRLRRWARQGVAEELDLDGTIRATAAQGWLDVQTRPERRNAVKVLLLLDIGGSMDPHIKVMEELFAAARSEFRHLEVFYFHNCIYEGLWRDIIVGDATMSPYEITHPGGANEHWNPEAGELWLRRIRGQWPLNLWINPVVELAWGYTRSSALIREIFEGRMVPMTLDGLAKGIRELR